MTSIEISPPGSPPELRRSRSSKSSSFRSSSLTDIEESLHDVTNYGETKLVEPHIPSFHHSDSETIHCGPAVFKPPPARYPAPLLARNRSSAHAPNAPKDLTKIQNTMNPALKGHDNYALRVRPPLKSASRRGLRRGFTSPASPSSSGAADPYRHSLFRSPAESPASLGSIPGLSTSTKQDQLWSSRFAIRRGSWQSSRKSTKELEAEYDDADDDVPDDAVFWNIPITPRLPCERSLSGSPESGCSASPPPTDFRSRKFMSAPLGDNLNARKRSTYARPRIGHSVSVSAVPDMCGSGNIRVKSWRDALDDLSEDARLVTQALEAYAATTESQYEQLMPKGLASQRPSLSRTRTAMPALPPVQKGNVMIDPLPISKEKEKMLSRTRPSWLPPKSQKEDKRHMKEYQQMMVLAQATENRKAVKDQNSPLSSYVPQASVSQIWDDVLSDWDLSTRDPRTRDLYWNGIPSRLRGQVWQKAVRNELQLSPTSYKSALARAKALDKKFAGLDASSKSNIKEALWFDAIRKDANSVYPEVKIFQSGGPLHSGLVDVLMAYSMYRLDVEYAYGTHFIAALLLLNLPASDAFIVLANILNRPMPNAFLTNDISPTSRAYSLVIRAVQHHVPKLYAHFASMKLPPAEYLGPLFNTLFTKSASVDVANRVWDVMVFEGDEVLIKAAVAVMMKLEGKLYGTREEIVGVLGWGNEKVWDLDGEDEFVGLVRSVRLGVDEREKGKSQGG